MTLQYTNHLKLAVPDFLTEPWHDEFRAAMDAVDQIVYEAIVAANIVLWANSTVYTIGKIVISPDDGLLYAANVAHTSVAAPTTFAATRAANPTFWSSFLPTLASQAEAEAGLENTKYMSALRTKQAILAISPPATIASQAEAEAGVENTKTMTALRVKQAVTAFTGPGAGGNIIGGYLLWTVSANVLTVAVKNNVNDGDPSAANPVWIKVRDTTITGDKESFVKLTAALSQTLSVGSTIGVSAINTAFNISAVLVDPSSPQIGLVNTLSGMNILALTGWGITSTLAEGGVGGADSAQVVYTASVLASKGYGVIGFATWSSGLGTLGNWSVAPDRVQLYAEGVPLPGARVQSALATLTTVVSGATLVPFDDTIPQITEGDQYLTLPFTPRSAANILEIDVQAPFGSSTTNWVATMLFQDALPDALACALNYIGTASTVLTTKLFHMKLAGTTAAITLRLRAGNQSAANLSSNASGGGARLYGGTLYTYIRAEEIMR